MPFFHFSVTVPRRKYYYCWHDARIKRHDNYCHLILKTYLLHRDFHAPDQYYFDGRLYLNYLYRFDALAVQYGTREAFRFNTNT